MMLTMDGTQMWSTTELNKQSNYLNKIKKKNSNKGLEKEMNGILHMIKVSRRRSRRRIIIYPLTTKTSSSRELMNGSQKEGPHKIIKTGVKVEALTKVTEEENKISRREIISSITREERSKYIEHN
jgi:hypothetical protein